MWTEAIKTEPVQSASLSDLKVMVDLQGDAAIASYQLDFDTRHPDGSTTREHGFETDIWFKHKGEWRIHAIHYSVAAK
jgi:ketosteroid isomerase-like protein